MLVILSLTGGWSDLFRVLRNRQLVLVMTLSSLLLAGNWLLYIYATVTNRVAEAGIGYYMLPLVNAALATFFLGERLRPAHYPALGLVTLGVVIPLVARGEFTWLPPSLAASFGIYGLVRKKAPIESSTGLTIETMIMLLPSLAYLAFLSSEGKNHFGSDWALNGLIAFSGIVTVVPLLTFTLSIRRLPLLAVSFIQFLSPTVQVLIAVTLFQEELTSVKLATLVCVGLAVAIFIWDALRQTRGAKKVEVCADIVGKTDSGLLPKLPVTR
jgi:chloramphenicol-sensitive protein RarD